MLVIPRLELLRGTAARGNSADSAGFLRFDDAIIAARAWAAEGYSRLQIVERDPGARGSNLSLVENLARDGGVEIDVSAGADSMDQIESWIDAGASRVILSSRALAEDDWLRSTAETFPNALIVDTNGRDLRETTRGWVRTRSIDLRDLADDLDGLPIAGLIVAAPAGSAPTLGLLEDVAELCSFPVLTEDLHPTMSALRAFEHRGLGGVVVPAAALATALDPRAVANEFAD
jgi:phosphoribosylformimino-5-aminoimidazole carboxamide ribonucleotide (ProFAR) isomerase